MNPPPPTPKADAYYSAPRNAPPADKSTVQPIANVNYKGGVQPGGATQK